MAARCIVGRMLTCVKKLVPCVLAIGIMAGCVSLYSDDPEMRKQAMAQIADEDRLFLIAMDLDAHLDYKSNSTLIMTRGNYYEDVRVAAVKKLSNPLYLLKCATWSDGELIGDSERGDTFRYNGEEYKLNGDYRQYLNVNGGDAVRQAAIERLIEPEMFKKIVVELTHDICAKKEDDDAGYVAKHMLLPTENEKIENGAFYVNWGRNINPNNPLNQVLTKVLEKQSTTDVQHFLIETCDWAPAIAPYAYDSAQKLSGSLNSDDAEKLYKKMFLSRDENDRSCARVKAPAVERMYNGGSSAEGYAEVLKMAKNWAWEIYRYIENPDAETVKSAMEKSSPQDVDKILARVKNPDALVSVYSDSTIAKNMSKDKRNVLSLPYGAEAFDLTHDAAVEMLGKVNDQGALSALASKSKLFSVRVGAIERITDEKVLSKIAHGEINDCPYDTSLPGCNMLESGIDWNTRSQNESKIRIQKVAIARMKDAKNLKDVRKTSKSSVIKDAVTERLKVLGVSDVAEVCAYTNFDEDLFVMLKGIVANNELLEVAKKAKLKGVRLLAASKLKGKALIEVAKRESADVKSHAEKGKFDLDGLYLGVDIQDAFAILLARYPETNPYLYVDDEVLCIAGENGKDIAWAMLKSCQVHWLTLPPAVVKKMANFKSGSFDDLERAVSQMFGVNFGTDLLRKGNVSQCVGTIDTVDGETLRYFKSEIGKGEDFARSIRKAVNQHTIETNPLNGGFGAALANAFENAQQAAENRKNASAAMFAQQGSLQLQLTKNAEKGAWGAAGSLRSNATSAIGRAVLDAVKGKEALKSVESELDGLKKAGEQLKDIGRELNNSIEQMNSLPL